MACASGLWDWLEVWTVGVAIGLGVAVLVRVAGP